jgi:hypothetical protein
MGLGRGGGAVHRFSWSRRIVCAYAVLRQLLGDQLSNLEHAAGARAVAPRLSAMSHICTRRGRACEVGKRTGVSVLPLGHAGTTRSLHLRRSALGLPAPIRGRFRRAASDPASDRTLTAIHDAPNASGVAIDQVGPPARATHTQLRHRQSQSMLPPSTPSFLRRKSPNRSASARTSATASGRA